MELESWSSKMDLYMRDSGLKEKKMEEVSTKTKQQVSIMRDNGLMVNAMVMDICRFKIAAFTKEHSLIIT